MSLLQKLQQTVKSEWKPKAHNIPVKVTGYDGDKVLGIRLDTEEAVVASLRPLTAEEAARLKEPRPEIKDFTANIGAITKKLAVCDTKEEKGEFLKSTKKVEPGGVIMFQQAEIKGDQIVAKWAVSMSRFGPNTENEEQPDHRAVLANKLVRVNPTYVNTDPTTQQKKYVVSATVIDVESATKVSDRAQLAETIAAAFQANGILNGAGAMVRYFEKGEDGVDVPVIRELYLGRTKVGEDYQFNDPLERAKQLLAEDDFCKVLAEGFEPGEGVVLEVIPTLRASMSPKAISNDLNKSHEIITGKNPDGSYVKGKIPGEQYMNESRNSGTFHVFSDNPKRVKRGFIPSSISLEFNGDYDPMYVVVSPVDIGRRAVAAEYVKTANIEPVRPKFVKEAEAKEAETNTPAADAAGQDFPVPDPDEFSDDAPGAARRSRAPGL